MIRTRTHLASPRVLIGALESARGYVMQELQASALCHRVPTLVVYALRCIRKV